MAKIYCHINQCDASVKYFAILHAHKYCTMSRKPKRLKIKYTLTFIRKNKRHSAMRQSLQQKAFVAQQNSGGVRQKILPYDKTVIASIQQNIGFVQY